MAEIVPRAREYKTETSRFNKKKSIRRLQGRGKKDGSRIS
jgi:hypothetical protein